MPQHIFFSWQSDVPNPVGRSLIERALERAIGKLRTDADVDPADRDVAIDRDTMDVPGSPPILETIFGKIDRATAFLSDLTFVAQRANGSRCPNPNVCIEHGYALKAVSWRRVIAVMNTAYGHPDEHELPFDLRHARRPILFDCPDGAAADIKSAARDALTTAFVTALRVILTDQTGRAAGPPAEPHPHDVALLAQVRDQLGPELQRFLRQHNFGTPFRRATLDPLFIMNEDWVGAAYEFHDAQLQASFSAVRAASEALGELVLERIYVMDRNPALGWPKTDMDVARGIQPTTLKAITSLNDRASALADAIDAFERLARDRIRVAHPAPVAQEDLRPERAVEALAELALDAQRGALPEIVTRPRMTLRLIPFVAIDGGRLDAGAVLRAQLRFPPLTSDRVETDSDGRQWWSCGPRHRLAEGLNPETGWRMRLVRPGFLEFQETIGRRIDDDPEIAIDGRLLEGRILHMLERMASIALELGFAGPALAQLGLDGIDDVQLLLPRGAGRRMRIPELVLPCVALPALEAPLADALREPLDMLWQAAGWPHGSPSFSGEQWAGYTDMRNYGELGQC